MDEESHLNPLAKNYEKSDGIATNIKPLNIEAAANGGSSKKVVYILLAVVVASIAFLIFGLVVLRIKAPTLRLSNVVVKELRYNSSSSLNMTVIAGLRLHNMNFGRFQFGAGSATLFYGNATIGAAEVQSGEVGGRERREMSATVEVMSSDVKNISEWDLVKLRSYAELRGEIGVMKIVNRHRTAFMNCSMDLNLTTQAIQGYSCR